MANPGQYTVRMWEQLPDDGNRYEVLDGNLIVTQSPDPQHQLVQMRLAAALHTFVAENRLGVAWTGAELHFDRYTVLAPDIIVGLDPALSHLPSWKELPDPALVVEVLSPASAGYEHTRKRARYLERCAEYWAVDPGTRTVGIWRRGDARPLAARHALVWEPRPGAGTLTIWHWELFAGLD